MRESPARTRPAEREPFRVGAVQLAWSADADEHRANLVHGVGLAAGKGAQLVCLQELTLSPYFAVSDRGPGPGLGPARAARSGGPTLELATALAVEHDVFVHASLYEQVPESEGGPPADGRGFNTAMLRRRPTARWCRPPARCTSR